MRVAKRTAVLKIKESRAEIIVSLSSVGSDVNRRVRKVVEEEHLALSRKEGKSGEKIWGMRRVVECFLQTKVVI